MCGAPGSGAVDAGGLVRSQPSGTRRPRRHSARPLPSARRAGRGHAELPRAVGVVAGCRAAPRRQRPERRGAPQARPGDWPRDPRTARELHRVAPRSAISAAKVDGPGDRGSRSGEGGEAPATHQLHSRPVPQWPPARDRSGSSLAGCASRPLIVRRRSGAAARAWLGALVIRARRQVHGAPRGADWLLARVHSAQGRAAQEGGTIGLATAVMLDRQMVGSLRCRCDMIIIIITQN